MAQWSPELKNQGAHSLYGAAIGRIAACGGRVAGIAWYQGCSDADEAQAKVYTERMKKLVAAFRRDSRDKELPFVVVQISRVAGARYGGHRWWNSIRDQQRLLPAVIRNLLTVPAIDLSLEDGIHICGKDCIEVGRRCALAMAVLRYKVRHIKPPIVFKSVAVEKDRYTGTANIRVVFGNVMGGLCAPGRPYGFDLTERQHEITNDFIFRTDIVGSSVLLKTIVMPEEAGAFWLYYGFGTHPYCNIVDEAGRSLPMFGPVHLGRYRAFTPFIKNVRVSPLLPSAGKLEALAYPADMAALKLSPRIFAENFCSLRPEIVAMGTEDKLIFYAFDFKNDEPMQLKLHLGYDGPVKVWCDSVEVFADPQGTNPAQPFDASIPINPAAGRHEVVVALGTNNGRAWGVHLRMTREDVSGPLIAAGNYTLPEILG
jgi:sialate O-acetylesterase